MARIIRISAGQNFLANGGKMQFPLDFLPSGYRVESIMVEFDGVVDVPAAGVTSDEQTRLVDAIESERRIRTSGIGGSAEDWQVNGRDVTRPAALAVGAGQAVKYFWPLGFRDPRHIDPKEPSPAVVYYRGKNLDVYVKKASDIVAGFAVVSGTVQLNVVLSEMPAGVVPPSIVMGYQEVIGKEVRLPAGAYVDLILVKNDGANVTEAELGNVQLTLDGKTNVLEKARTPQLARSFNYFVASGTTHQAASAEGEALPNDGALPFVPLVHPIRPYKATQLHRALEYAILTFDGTLAPNTARVFYRLVEPQDEAQTFRAAAKLGIPFDADTIAVGKTASKNGIPAGAPFRFTAGLMSRRIGKRA